MKRKLLFLSLAASIFAFSCTKAETNDPSSGGSKDGFIRVEINAGTEGIESKTSLGDAVSGVRKISWVKDDAIRIIYGNSNAESVVARASASGETTIFTAEVPEGTTTLYAVYPADAFESISNGELTINVPSWQDGEFASSNIAVAKTNMSDLNFSFKNVCSYVLMDLSNDNIRKVTLTAPNQALAGRVPVTFDSNGNINLGEIADATSEVSAYFSNPGQCIIGVLPNVSFKDGIGVTFADSNADFVSSTTLTNDYTLTRGSVLNTGKIDDAISINLFATVAGAGSKDGSSWSNAFDAAALKAFLEEENPDFSDKAASAGIIIAVAEGNYSYTEGIQVQTKGRDLTLVGGYAADDPSSSVVDYTTNIANFTCTEAVNGIFFDVVGSGKFTFNGLTFSGHKGNGTGKTALYVHAPASESNQVYFNNCTIKNNTNTGVGAGCVVYSGGYVSFSNCNFTGNKAGGAAALNVDKTGTICVVNSCTFDGNTCTAYSTAQDSGAAIKVGNGKLTVSNSTFRNNSVAADANGGGGAVWVATEGNEEIRFNNCTFTGNKVNNELGKGGAVYITRGQNTYFSECNFEKNACVDTTNTSYGGAVMIGNGNNHGEYDITTTFTSCTFDGNSVARVPSTRGGYGGGGIFMTQADEKTTVCNVNQCTFKNHKLDDLSGCAIFARDGKLNVVDGLFTQNDNTRTSEGDAGSYGTAICVQHADLVVTGATKFTNNTASNGGPAIFLDYQCNGTCSVTGATFDSNKTVSSGGGAVRIAIGGVEEVLFKNCTFSNNTGANNGGAIVVYRGQDMKIDGCTFTSNQVTSSGGAIYIGGEDESKNTVTIVNSTFNSNYGYNGGGAIAMHNAENKKIGSTTTYRTCQANLSISGCTFNGNNSVGYGGAIDSRTSGTLSISDTKFENNYTTSTSSTGCGGAISLKYGQTKDLDATLRGKANISNCVFDSNHTANGKDNSKGRGGAIAMTASSNGDSFIDVRVNNCTFLGNYATQGGAILGHGNKTTPGISFYMNNCILDSNYAYFRNGTAATFFCMKEVGINNITVKNCYVTSTQSSGNCPWINFNGFNITVANSTMIGQVQLRDDDTSDYEVGGLIRIEPVATSDVYNFINNIIASPKSWCSSMFAANTTAPTLNLYSNKMGFLNGLTATNTDSYNGVNYLGTSSYFGGLSYSKGSTPTYANTYWTWNGTLATGTPTTKNSLSDVNSKIQAANGNFYTWLNSVGGLNKDQRGTARGTTTTPGAYQAN